jgi:hypothetical protein
MRSTSFILVFSFILFNACSKLSSRASTIKDLDECMIDLKAYQENMGDLIKAKQLQDAEWLWQGADSLLQVMNTTFVHHRKLNEKPFSFYYEQKLEKPFKNIGEAIRLNDTAMALSNYKLLIKKCNSCHIDLDIEKEVKY